MALHEEGPVSLQRMSPVQNQSRQADILAFGSSTFSWVELQSHFKPYLTVGRKHGIVCPTGDSGAAWLSAAAAKGAKAGRTSMSQEETSVLPITSPPGHTIIWPIFCILDRIG